MLACVTGGGGFVAGWLVKRLLDEGYEVRAADIKSKDDWWQWHPEAENLDLCDLRSWIACHIACEGVDEVYQLAADMGGAGFVFSGENDAAVMHNSAQINLNIAEMARQGRFRTFYSSSACCYNQANQTDPNNPNCEESTAYPANPDSEYGWEKIFSERLYAAYARNHGLDVRIARFHNVMGPCFDEHTEILTERGWKLFRDLTDERVATLSPTGDVEYWLPDAYQAFPYSGPMYTCESSRVNFSVTPEHALYISSRTTEHGKTVSTDFRRVAANSSLWTNARIDFTCQMNWPEDDGIERSHVFPEEHMKDGRSMRGMGGGRKEVPLGDWLEFAGYFIADGSSWITPSNHTVAITKYRPDKTALKEQIADVVRRMGFHFSRSGNDHDIIISSKQLWRAVQQLGVGANNKTFPRAWLNLPRKYLRKLFDALMSCDGDTDGGRYSTSSVELADLFMELAMKLGKRAVLERDHIWRIHLSDNTRLGTRRNDRVCTEYSGMVYDVTVRNHIIMVRRGGKAHWSGNCGSWRDGREKAPAAICRKVATAKLTGDHRIEIWGDGNQTRSFCWIEDCVRGILDIMRGDNPEPVNLGSAEMVTINQLVDYVEEIAGIKLERSYKLDAPKGVAGRNSDNTEFKRRYGWEPSTSLRYGLERTYAWIDEQVKKELRDAAASPAAEAERRGAESADALYRRQ